MRISKVASVLETSVAAQLLYSGLQLMASTAE